jgi:hypothetical protein
MLFGIIDGGRLLWETNRAEKATQVGARVAVVTDVIAGGLTTYSFVGTANGTTFLTQGDKIPSGLFGSIRCDDTACTCVDGTACTADMLGTYNGAAFDRIVDRMKRLKPDITYENVLVEYHSSGLGFAGDPNGLDVAPMVTVQIRSDKPLKFQPITTLLLATFNLPTFATTLTAEDMAGTVSN